MHTWEGARRPLLALAAVVVGLTTPQQRLQDTTRGVVGHRARGNCRLARRGQRDLPEDGAR